MNLTIVYKILFTVFTYLFGAFPTAYIIYKLKKGGDIRKEGSGNVGGTNVTRTIGPAAGVGTIPILILYFIFPEDLILLAAVTVIAVLGHDYPVYLKFKGGKGISTSFGVMVGLCSLPFFGFENALWLRILPPFLILFTWLIVFLASRIVSLSSLVAAIATPLSFYFTKYPLPIVIAAICLSILTFIAHRDNIKRLIKGEEKKIKRKGA